MNNEARNFLIGSYQFDPRARLLVGPGGDFTLTPDTAAVIAELVEHAGEPVRRQQIIESVWDGDESADRLLTLDIRSLRRYLGDSCHDPQFIETVPGYGYRLVAPVRPLLTPADGDRSPQIPSRDAPGDSGLWQFLHELRQRKVCRAALMYAVTIWLICQIGDVVFEALNFPAWLLPLIVVLGILGFPIALILAWMFEVTPAGLTLDVSNSSQDAGARNAKDVRWNHVLLAASVLISIQMLLYGFGAMDATDDRLERLRSADSIVVTPFQATNVSLETKAYAFVLSEEVRHLLHSEYKMKVLSADAAGNLTDEQKRADLMLQGSVTIARGETQIIVHLVDPSDGYDLWSDMIVIPDSGTAQSQHQAARSMLRALPIGDGGAADQAEAYLAKAD